MALVIGGVVTLNQIISRGRTTTLTDAGAIDGGLSITGQTAKRWHTAAQAKEVERLLHELAWYSRGGGVHINSDEFDIDDGLYTLSGVETAMDQQTWGGAAILRVSLTLRRLGGGVSGGNITQAVYLSPALQTNSFSLTADSWQGFPVGATSLYPVAVTSSVNRTSADGAMAVYGYGASAARHVYMLNGGEVSRAECKVWDTGGDASEANWKRVYGPDHAFADPKHCVVDNGLVRYAPHTSNPGNHVITCYAGGAWTTVGSSAGDTLEINGSAVAGWTQVLVESVTPWRARVTYTLSLATSPFAMTKTIMLERGKHLAAYEFAIGSAATIKLSLLSTRLTFVRPGTGSLNPGNLRIRDHSVETGLTALSPGSSANWIASISPSGTVMSLIAFQDFTGTSIYKSDSEGIAVVKSSATSLKCYVGGLPYAAGTTMLQEAEAGILGGASSIATFAGSSGGGTNNIVAVPNAGDTVQMQNTLPHGGVAPTSATVYGFARVVQGTSAAGDSFQVEIFNATAGTALTGSTQSATFAALGSAGAHQWVAVEGSGWNGTDSLRLRITRTVAGSPGNFLVDEMALIGGDSTALWYAHDLASTAVTHVDAWAATLRQGT